LESRVPGGDTAGRRARRSRRALRWTRVPNRGAIRERKRWRVASARRRLGGVMRFHPLWCAGAWSAALVLSLRSTGVARVGESIEALERRLVQSELGRVYRPLKDTESGGRRTGPPM